MRLLVALGLLVAFALALAVPSTAVASQRLARLLHTRPVAVRQTRFYPRGLRPRRKFYPPGLYPFARGVPSRRWPRGPSLPRGR